MHKVTVDELQKLNHIENDRKLQIGQTLVIPGTARAAVTLPFPEPHRLTSDGSARTAHGSSASTKTAAFSVPLPFEQVRRWAAAAQVAPHDKLSHDQQTWLKAPMFPELEMDWLVEVTSERYYGPTTLGAVHEFLRLGEIGEETFVINSCDGSRRQIRELTDLIQLPGEETIMDAAGAEKRPPPRTHGDQFARPDQRPGAESFRGTPRAGGMRSALPRTGSALQRAPGQNLDRALRLAIAGVICRPSAIISTSARRLFRRKLCSQSRAYFPPNDSSSACVPRSMIRP